MALQGVLIDGLYSVEFAIANYALPEDTDKKGAVTVRYSSRETIQARIEQKPAKAGALIGFYDPVIAAILGTEI